MLKPTVIISKSKGIISKSKANKSKKALPLYLNYESINLIINDVIELSRIIVFTLMFK